MYIFYLLVLTALFTVPIVLYLISIKTPADKKEHYRLPRWNYSLKLILSRYIAKRWKSRLPKTPLCETPRKNQTAGWDEIALRASAPDGSVLLLGIRKVNSGKSAAEVTIHLKLKDGTNYTLPQHPKTAVSEWINTDDGWSASGLKIQVLESQTILRILFNGLLTRVEDNNTQHAKFNLIWSSATSVVSHPEDWSSELAAETLALEPWRDGNWSLLLDKCVNGTGSWMQWGALQGRFQSFDANGVVDRNEYLRVRGVRERNWSNVCKNPRRTIAVTAAAPDGTAVQIRGLSHYNNFTQCISGSVRFPNFTVKSIKSTDLVMSDFCEKPDEIPNTYIINVETENNRTLRLIIRINKDGGRIIRGVSQQQEEVYRTLRVDIDGEHGSGTLELGYDLPGFKSEVPFNITPRPVLKCLGKQEAGEVDFCLPLEMRAAACTDYVGGKGASLALLASVQEPEGYCVPPGFCITTKALNKQLENNSKLRSSINEIEAATENYEESIFKEKCEQAVDLFLKTEIVEEVKIQILTHLNDLRRKATPKIFGSPLRFAVRSSAVGEDSEALSAAGQNETVLGCVSDEDALRGVQKCWASMFSFTSVYYRRQNGQPCLCEGGVVIQALVAPRVAGVMFTRHPDHGDPTRILITANYGLGESVVSGSVEPDTIIVKRGIDGQHSIAKVEIGSKTHKISATSVGVAQESVEESERTKPCLSEQEILKLAKIGVSQDKLWGAGRDIEWAINNNTVFLLQARPITSLERWTEEELLHELDFPIMSDDELITFANTGEVLPKPLTALSYDMVFYALEKGISSLIRNNGDGYDKSVIVTHNRGAICLYNSVYRRVPKKVDIGIQMLEMSIHGHRVADEAIIATAVHRREPRAADKIVVILDMLKALVTTKSIMNDTVRCIIEMNVNIETDDPMVLLNAVAAVRDDMVKYCSNHGSTSAASTFTQFIAMTVLLEGRSDFTSEECNEISTLLGSGDVLSAEVPQALATLARNIKHSGKLDEFRNQDPKYALTWLKNNLRQVYDDVCLFLDRHGHRAIMEFDLSSKPWVLVPEELMKVLMHIKTNKEEKHQIKTSDEIIASLKTPKKSSTRKVLRWVLPLCRRTVRHREITKAYLILGVHKLRLAALALGRALVRRWLIPNQDLVFHFRVNELTKYIITRDPALLKKAVQRQQFYSNWSKLKFAELYKGWPEPNKVEGPRLTSGDVTLKATSVCGGEVVARACVVKDLSEISQLQQGDILITHSTDIGWSPYFPLLSGIVTELGGLISHGAVIAREYGLPCIVGATRATEMFRTGDTVRLSGTEGVVHNINIVEKQN